MKFRTLIALVSSSLALLSCTNEGYGTGDNGNSYLTSDFAMLRTNSGKLVSSATLDDGSELTFSNPFSPSWTAKADTVYRALLYYDAARTDDHDAALTAEVKARGAVQVPVLGIVDAASVRQMKTDPLDVESLWMSKNGRYLNVSLLLKSGSAENDSRQSIGIVLEGSSVDQSGKRHAALRVYHDQNSVPQYYTVQQFASVDVARLDADTVDFRVNTSKGETTRTIGLAR